MKKEDINLVGRLLTAMKTAVQKLELAISSNNQEMLSSAKAEIISYHLQLKKIL